MPERDSFDDFERQFNEPKLRLVSELVGNDPEKMPEDEFDKWADMHEDSWGEDIIDTIKNRQNPPDELL